MPRFPFGALLSVSLMAPLAAQAQAPDSDEDGVPDTADAFPCDPTAAAAAYYPSQSTSGLLLAEDRWPASGDLDFNDVVIAQHLDLRLDGAGRLVTLVATYDVLALGGSLDNGLGLHLPVPRANAASITRSIGGAAATPLTALSDSELTIEVVPNLRALYGRPGPINAGNDQARSEPVRVTLRVDFGTHPAINADLAPFDVFVIRADDTSLEIHRPEYGGSARMNTARLGTADDRSTATRRFVDRGGVPFVLLLPSDALYPAEGIEISRLFPRIVDFAASGGATAQDFYATNVVTSQAFVDAQGQGRWASPAIATSVPDQSCRILCEAGRACTSCLAILEAGLSEGDGIYPVDPDGSGPGGEIETFCDMTREGGGWSLAAKYPNAAPEDDPRTNFFGGTANASDAALKNRSAQNRTLSTPLMTTYYSRFGEARFEVLSSGQVRQFVVYDARNASAHDTLVRSRARYSSWTDLLTESQNYWSADGDAGLARYFFINRNYGGCPSDAGWFAFVRGTTCPWETSRTRALIYAAGSTYTNLTTGNIAQADAIALFVRERPPRNPQVAPGSSCLALRESGLATSGVYLVDPEGTGAYPVYCDMTTDGGGWTMAYKHSAGVFDGNVAAGFLSGNLNATDETLLDRQRAYRDYSNAMISRLWYRFADARVEVLRGGVPVQYLRYRLANTSPSTFFSRTYLADASWRDLTTESQNFWGVSGDAANARNFFINRNYGGCAADMGWLGAFNGASCAWETSRPASILYANAPLVQNWTSGAIAQADALAVFVRERRPTGFVPPAVSCNALRASGVTTSGIYTLDPGESGAPVRAYCDMTTEGGGWTLAYKHSAGLGVGVSATLAGVELNATDEALMDRDRETRDFAGSFLASTYWARSTEARVEVLVGGQVRRYMVFRTASTTPRSFMSAANLLRSDWTDLATAGQNYFSIDGDTSCRRETFINRNYGGCTVDSGWLASITATGCGCGWETANPNSIRYATATTNQNWTSGAVASADAIAIFVR